MNGSNPVKDNSLSQQRVWNAQTRAFVKCIAIHTGLGFDLWLKEETNASKKDAKDLSGHDIFKVKERVEQLITIKMQGGLTLNDIAKGLGLKNSKQLDSYMEKYEILDRFEKAIGKL